MGYSIQSNTYLTDDALMDNVALFHRINGDRFLMSAMLSLIGLLSYEDDESIEKFEEIFKKSLAAYQGRELAWKRFCEEIGIDGDALKKVSMVDDSIASEFLIGLNIAYVEPDMEAEARCHEMLSGMIA